MKPIVKKAIAALAIKEGVEKIQEIRKPKKPTIGQRLLPLGIIAAIAGIGLFLYKNKLNSQSNAGYEYTGSPSSPGGTF